MGGTDRRTAMGTARPEPLPGPLADDQIASPVPAAGAEPKRIKNPRDMIRLGQWCWIEEDKERDLWCAVDFGSNYVLFDNPYNQEIRIHIDQIHERCKPEPNAPAILQERVVADQQAMAATTAKIEALCRQLGLSDRLALPEQAAPMTTALAPLSGKKNLRNYKRALAVAKDKTLPALLQELRKHTERLRTDMTAEALPLEAYAKRLNGCVDEVKERIFVVELYGGLLEEVKQITKGAPAGMAEPICIMQGRLYMDEECLLDYRAGGMDFRRLSQFDAWLAKPANLARLLPFPRSVTAFRVRREGKGYGQLNPYIRFNFDRANMETYLAIRNGENLYRIATGINFGEKLFPDKKEFDFDQPVYAKIFAADIDKVYTEAEVDDIRATGVKAKAEAEAWEKANPDEHFFNMPWDIRKHIEAAQEAERFVRMHPSDVHYDDIREHFAKQIKDYNRIVLVLQGLLDRSDVFAPHPPTKLWKEGNDEFIKLVHDADRVFFAGDPPGFRAYQDRVNARLKTGSLTVGQQDYWAVATTNPDRRDSCDHDIPYRKSVYGDRGPALVYRVQRYRPRVRVCEYVWQRETWNRYNGSGVANSRLKVPCSWLLNIDAYKPGDYLQFFRDPRTRAKYLDWAPLMLTAEDYKAGKTKEGAAR